MVETTTVNGHSSNDSEIREPNVLELKNQEIDVAAVESACRDLKSETCNGQFYGRTMDLYRILSKEETLALARRNTDEAREKLALHNLRLVFYVAKRYLNHGLDLEDLVQEGNVGLMKAVQKYSAERDCTFPTYAIWWIKQRMLRALANQGKTIRLPVHVNAMRLKIRKVAEELQQLRDRRPTVNEIAEKLGIEVQKVIVTFASRGTVVYSLDQDLEYKDGSQSRYEYVADERGLDPAQALVAKDEAATFDCETEDLLFSLRKMGFSQRNVNIFAMFYNLDTDVKIYRTLESVAGQFNLTRESIRLIINKIWMKLEKSNHSFARMRQSLGIIQRTGGALSDTSSVPASTVAQLLASDPSSTVEKRVQKKCRMTRRQRFRASPALVNWVPTDRERLCRASAVLRFVKEAYELHELKPPPTTVFGVERWAQNVCIFLLVDAIKMTNEQILEEFPAMDCEHVYNALQCIQDATYKDPFIQEDMDHLRSHARKMLVV